MSKGKMTVCESCGKPFAAAVKACPYCGAKNKKRKKSPASKIILSVFVFFIVVGIIGSIGGNDKKQSASPKQSAKKEDTVKNEIEPEKEDAPSEDPSIEVTEPINDQEEARENFNALLGSTSPLFYENVRNDVTGRWRLLVCYTAENIVDHAIDYYNSYFESDDEVHFVVNLGLKTTTVINSFSGYLFLDVHEYIDKEEHDAKILGSGMTLKSYSINLSTGEVEDLSTAAE